MTTHRTKSWLTSPRIFARRWRRTPRLNFLAKIRREFDALFVQGVVIIDVQPRARKGGSATSASQTRWDVGVVTDRLAFHGTAARRLMWTPISQQVSVAGVAEFLLTVSLASCDSGCADPALARIYHVGRMVFCYVHAPHLCVHLARQEGHHWHRLIGLCGQGAVSGAERGAASPATRIARSKSKKARQYDLLGYGSVPKGGEDAGSAAFAEGEGAIALACHD